MPGCHGSTSLWVLSDWITRSIVVYAFWYTSPHVGLNLSDFLKVDGYH